MVAVWRILSSLAILLLVLLLIIPLSMSHPVLIYSIVSLLLCHVVVSNDSLDKVQPGVIVVSLLHYVQQLPFYHYQCSSK
jgi:hypothetical protein